MNRFLSIVAVPALLGFAACVDRLTPAARETKEEAPRLVVAAAADQEWGTVKGQVVFGGDKLPEVKNVNVVKDQEHCLSKGPIPEEDWVINTKNKGVRWAFVWLLPAGADPLPVHPNLKEIAKKEVEIDQPCCKFEPHAIALRKGQVLVAKNSAPIAHNVDWKGIKQSGGNTLVPPGGKLVIDKMKPSGYAITVSCGIHPWMKGWVWMFDHPYYAVTDADGKFEIKDAPAGKCHIVVWQEAVGYRTQAGKKGDPIQITGGGTTDLGTLEIKPRKD